MYKCPNCGTELVENVDGKYKCENCGKVFSVKTIHRYNSNCPIKPAADTVKTEGSKVALFF